MLTLIADGPAAKRTRAEDGQVFAVMRAVDKEQIKGELQTRVWTLFIADPWLIQVAGTIRPGEMFVASGAFTVRSRRAGTGYFIDYQLRVDSILGAERPRKRERHARNKEASVPERGKSHGTSP